MLSSIPLLITTIIGTLYVPISFIIASLFLKSYYPYPLSPIDIITVLCGALCMFFLIMFKKESMGFNRTTMVWLIFAIIYMAIGIVCVTATAWWIMFYIAITPFNADRMSKHRPFRKFNPKES